MILFVILVSMEIINPIRFQYNSRQFNFMTDSKRLNLRNNLILLLFVLLAFLPSTNSIHETGEMPFTTEDVIQIATEYQHKFPVNIQAQFSVNSDLSVVITSCDKYDQLQMAINSFFHFNSYRLNKVIIVEDCMNIKMTEDDILNEIKEKLPANADKYPDFFKIIVNPSENVLGQIGSIDKAYQEVNTKYVYYLEGDWIQLSGYGMLERMKDVLEDANKNGVNVSQVVQTASIQGVDHFRGPLHMTSHHTKYYEITALGSQQNLKPFSFNPHLIDIQRVYKKQLNSSFIESIAKKYSCLKNQNNIFMENGDCVEHNLGIYLNSKGYKQLFMEEQYYSELKHIGIAEFQKPQVYEFEFQKFDPRKLPEVSLNDDQGVSFPKPRKRVNKLSKVLLLISIGFAVASLIVYIRKKQLKYTQISSIEQDPPLQQ